MLAGWQGEEQKQLKIGMPGWMARPMLARHAGNSLLEEQAVCTNTHHWTSYHLSPPLQDVPSSHGSSLVAVLRQLGLSGPGGSSGARGSAAARGGAAAGPTQRWLQHSSGADEFGSFKTAQGSIHDASAQSSGALDPRPTEADSSWHSAASCGSSRQAAGQGGPLGSGALCSTASSSLPDAPAQQPAGRVGGSADGTQAAAAGTGTPARRLSSAAAGQRAASLQEEHLHGFRSSGQEQASRQAASAAKQRGTAH